MDEVAFSKRTADEILDGVDGAHVGLDDGNDFLIFSVRADFTQRDLRCPNPDRQSRAHVAVKPHNVVNLVSHRQASGSVKRFRPAVQAER